MVWGKGIGKTGIMTVEKLHSLLGEMIENNQGDLFVHGIANGECLYAGEMDEEGLCSEVAIDFVGEKIE